MPGALFIIDPKKEYIAVREANRLNIPVVALCDTNCDPDGIDFVIPGNDDAIRSIKLITSRVADACVEGTQRRKDHNEDPGGDRDNRVGRGLGLAICRGMLGAHGGQVRALPGAAGWGAPVRVTATGVSALPPSLAGPLPA